MEICGEKKDKEGGRKREAGKGGGEGGRKRKKEEKGRTSPMFFSAAPGSFHAAEKLPFSASYLCQILTKASN